MKLSKVCNTLATLYIDIISPKLIRTMFPNPNTLRITIA